MSSIKTAFILMLPVWLLATSGIVVYSQDLNNHATGKVNNRGVIRLVSDNGLWRNEAPVDNTVNDGAIEFAGTDNVFTDISGNRAGATALGVSDPMRVPGLVRYMRASGNQNVHSRYYTDLEMTAGSQKVITDGVFLGRKYTIVQSGDRLYSGTFTYDGVQPQSITGEAGLMGTRNRYDNLTVRSSTKSVDAAVTVRVNAIFTGEDSAPLNVLGNLFWGTNSTADADVSISQNGLLVTGSGTSVFAAAVDVLLGEFRIADNSGIVTLLPSAALSVANNNAALLSMGVATHLEVLGSFVNRYPPRTNTTFHASSLVHYGGSLLQVIQSTVSTHPYGSLKTSVSQKTPSGDVFIADSLSVNDADVNMVPYMLSMTTGKATYTDHVEVVGAFQRNLASGAASAQYVFNNSETRLAFSLLPNDITLDVRPSTDPNAFDNTTDVQRKVNVRFNGDWKASIRIGYKASDIPPTWVPTVSEVLIKMYNAPITGNPVKLTPTVPPTYARRPLAQSTGLAFAELAGVSGSGPDNMRVDSGNDLLLRARRDTLKSIAAGRWSNPDTWDEGREPEPVDDVLITGFTVHVGYIRANDNYAINEAWPDRMAKSVRLADVPLTGLLIGSQPGFDTFSLVPDAAVKMIVQRKAPAMVTADVMDVTASPIDAGLLVYRGAFYSVPNLTVDPGATVFNAGLLEVGSPTP